MTFTHFRYYLPPSSKIIGTLTMLICSVHSGAFVAYSGVTPVSFLFVAVSFQLVPVYSGTILVHSVLFRRHSGSFRYIPVPFLSIPASFRLVPVYSGLFRYIPFRSIPFLCLVTPPIKYVFLDLKSFNASPSSQNKTSWLILTMIATMSGIKSSQVQQIIHKFMKTI